MGSDGGVRRRGSDGVDWCGSGVCMARIGVWHQGLASGRDGVWPRGAALLCSGIGVGARGSRGPTCVGLNSSLKTEPVQVRRRHRGGRRGNLPDAMVSFVRDSATVTKLRAGRRMTLDVGAVHYASLWSWGSG